MLKGEEFRKISSLSIQSVPRFFWASRRGKRDCCRQGKDGSCYFHSFTQSRCFKNLETNIALKLLLVSGRIACKCVCWRLEIEWRGLQNVFLSLVVHRCSFVLTGTRLPRISWLCSLQIWGVLLVISPRSEYFINADSLALRCGGGHPKLALLARFQLLLHLEFVPNWLLTGLSC